MRIIQFIFIFLSIIEISEAHPAKFHKDREIGVSHIKMTLNKTEAEATFIATSLDFFERESFPEKKDKRSMDKLAQARKNLEEKAKDFIKFDKSLNCKTDAFIIGLFIKEHTIDRPDKNTPVTPTSKKLSAKKLLEEEPKVIPKADLHIRLKTKCEKAFKGKKIRFAVSANYPQIHKTKVYIFDGKNIMARNIKKDKGYLKP